MMTILGIITLVADIVTIFFMVLILIELLRK